jgi:hypothetical protein
LCLALLTDNRTVGFQGFFCLVKPPIFMRKQEFL